MLCDPLLLCDPGGGGGLCGAICRGRHGAEHGLGVRGTAEGAAQGATQGVPHDVEEGFGAGFVGAEELAAYAHATVLLLLLRFDDLASDYLANNVHSDWRKNGGAAEEVKWMWM